jgi:hypothetical protein
MLPISAPTIVTEAVSPGVPEVAVTTAVPAVLEAVKVPVATPDTVVAVGVIVPNDGLSTSNATTVPSGTERPALSRTVADTVAVPRALKPVAGDTETVIVAAVFVALPPEDGPPFVVPRGVLSVTESFEHPLSKNADIQNRTSHSFMFFIGDLS